jgi:hypothetical protein
MLAPLPRSPLARSACAAIGFRHMGLAICIYRYTGTGYIYIYIHIYIYIYIHIYIYINIYNIHNMNTDVGFFSRSFF